MTNPQTTRIYRPGDRIQYCYAWGPYAGQLERGTVLEIAPSGLLVVALDCGRITHEAAEQVEPDDIAALADQHEDARYDEDGDAAYGIED